MPHPTLTGPSGPGRSWIYAAAAAGLWLSAAPAPAAAPAEDGIFATVDVTRAGEPMGSFCLRLEPERAPVTVANFVGLAEGSTPWLDFRDGRVRREPYFDGIIFHRVVPGFVIQGGSPNGQGSDGPGYEFPDEFHPELRHDRKGILSMANSGLNSNGSQFFVTLDETPHLDDVHNVFGEVVEGIEVVEAVAQGDVMERVVITRNGAAAQAFDPTAHGLPVLSPMVVEPRRGEGPGQVHLHYLQEDDTQYFSFNSPDLATWEGSDEVELYIDPPAPAPLDIGADVAADERHFYRIVRAAYGQPLNTIGSVDDRRIVLNDPGQGLVMTIDLDGETGMGSHTLMAGAQELPGDVGFYNWIRAAFYGRLVASIGGLQIGNNVVGFIDVSLVFDETRTAGTFKGSFKSQFQQPLANIAGTFTVEPAP